MVRSESPEGRDRRRFSRISQYLLYLAMIIMTATLSALSVFFAKGVPLASDGFLVRLGLATAALVISTLPAALLLLPWRQRPLLPISAWIVAMVVVAALMVADA